MDDSTANKSWEALAKAIDEIHNRNASKLSFEELYRNAYNLVLQKKGDLLYDKVESKVSSHLEGSLAKLTGAPESSLLDDMATIWTEHKMTMVMIRDILMYMDRTYINQSRRKPVYELGLHLFRTSVWEQAQVKGRVSELLLAAISSERVGLLTDDRTQLKATLGMLLELGQNDSSTTYEDDFEAVFLVSTQEFYQQESLDYLSRNTVSQYVSKVIKRIAEEKDRTSALALPTNTDSSLQTIMNTELIGNHAKTMVDAENSGFAALLKDDTKLGEMRAVYDLFVRVPSTVESLREALAKSIKADGQTLITDQERGSSDPAAFVRGVLAMRERYDKIVTESFRDEKDTSKRVRDSFVDFLNADARAASCLAVYVDELLRVGLRGANEEKINEELGKAIAVFRYLSDKDVFESFYKQHLAKRLLGAKSASEDAEKTMISLLKAEVGYQFTSKMEGMMQDMNTSQDMRENYKTFNRSAGAKSSSGKAVEIDANVLTLGYWPSQKVPPCALPVSVQEAMDHFSSFYLEKQNGRKLSWQTSMGSADLKATFGKAPNFRRYDLVVSTYQMCILHLYNDAPAYTFDQIQTLTEIPSNELRRHLVSLCTPKNRILRKASKKGASPEEDKYVLNVEYSSKLKRVRIPLVKDPAGKKGPSGAAATAANGAVPSSVEEDRRHLVEAAIVRIMKARKSLSHNDLIAEVSRQLTSRFKASPQFIKKRIESLIDREYLERSEKDHRHYSYVA